MNKFFSKYTLLVFVTLISAIGCKKADKAIQNKPNIILIFPDQLRQTSLGFWSQGDNAKHLQGEPDPVKTPAIDKFASNGIVFSRSISNFPLCSPYRAMLLSGMYPSKNGVAANCHKTRTEQLKTDAECISDVLVKKGYEAAYIGKCHWQRTEPLFDKNGTYHGTTEEPGGHFINAYDTYVPPGKDRHGFTYFYQNIKDSHMNPMCYSSDPVVNNGKKDGERNFPKRFNAESEAEVILKYLDNTHGQRDKSKPFFITWSLNPPHNPWTEEHTKMEFFDQYTNGGKVDMDGLLVRENADTLSGAHAPYYFANVSATDYYIGLVLDKISELGLDDNTIVVFSSDHGEMLGSHATDGRSKGNGKNVPEFESFNIPFIIKWGDKLKHRIDDLILSVPDVMPTILGLAGMEKDIPTSVQGVDYSSLLVDAGSNKVKRPNGALYIGYNKRGIYTGDYTYVVVEEKGKIVESFVYDNIKDPYQINRITDEEVPAELLKTLQTGLVKLLKETEDVWYTKKIGQDYLNYN
ncbi:MAG: sulfatase [Carboxylicivirga sp.]|jgi:arylsulfatase A-like enzyme|nr:sulfatase [Carboxylicivirga sp.]